MTPIHISKNDKINDFINYCFSLLCEKDKRIFLKKFQAQPKGSDQIIHTLRELVLGSYLIANNIKARYDYPIYKKLLIGVF